jgi:uncharacterized membrane protein
MNKAHFIVRASALLLVYFCTVASAQTVYKCANTYSDTPCPQGVAVSTADPRSPAQKAQTDQATVKAAALAGQLEKTRRADEVAAQRRADSQAKAAAQAAKTAEIAKANALRAEAKAKKEQAKTKVVKLATARKPKPKPAGESDAPPAGSGKATAAVTLKP